MDLHLLHKSSLHKIFIKLDFSVNCKYFLKLIILTFFFLNIYKVSYSQINNSYIVGKITSKENNKPVKNANVYLAYTMLGSSTDDNGDYSIKDIPSGRYTLVISHISYETYNIKIAIKEEGKYNFDIELKPSVYQFSTIRVTAEGQIEWEKNLEIFKESFIGTSYFAQNTFIVNPLDLDFNWNADDLLFANSQKPLIIINKALGYKIEYDLIHFELYEDYVKYSGFPKFSLLKTSNPDTLELWKFNRQKVYNGSLRHFLHAICKNYSITGKKLPSPENEINNSIKTDNGYNPEYLDYNFVEKNGFEVLYRSWLEPRFGIKPIIFYVNTNQYIKPTKNSNEMYLKFENYFEVQYQNLNKEKFPEDNDNKISWIKLEKDSVIIDKLGRYYETFGIKSYGFWATQRLADTLPYEYVYGDSLFIY
ncbi:MAG: carboxypeptidase-like regulatory domain-containing protein [Bacteroidetes bacterium]|nr:carboxypeptidase-like regulatory domain-containing protein [Bacteroidota bacterium]